LIPEPSGVPSSCQIANATDRYSSAADGYFALDGNLFGFRSNYTGSTSLCYYASNGTLTERMNFATPGAVTNGVLGYPEAILGQNIYGGVAGIQNPELPLPTTQVGNLTADDLWASLNYSVDAPGNATPYNFAFDDWLTPTPANGTLRSNVPHKIEVMLWFANDKGSWLKQTEYDIPSFLNGQPAPGTWYRDDWCGDHNETLTFDYLYSENGSSPGYGTTTGQLAVNMSYVFQNVANLTAQGSCWAAKGTNVDSFYADAFPLGAEFYPETSEHAMVNWSVTSYCYTLVAGTPTAAGTDCSASQSSNPDPLQAQGSSNATQGTAPLTVQFTGQASGGDPPYAYYWAFGDGNASSPNLDASFTYGVPGVYVANFSVADYDSIVTASNVTIVVGSATKLSIDVRASSDAVTTGSTVGLDALASGGSPPYTYSWSGMPTGPGCASANQSTLNCTVESPGNYTVTAHVTDNDGRSAKGSTEVTVTDSSSGSSPSHRGSSGFNWGTLLDPFVGLGVIILVIGLIVYAIARHRRSDEPPKPGTGAAPPESGGLEEIETA
jgi:PKD repeat protein